MPAVPLIEELQGRLTARLRELEPLVAEYKQLREWADRLGVSGAARPVRASTPTPRESPRARPRRQAAPRGTNRKPGELRTLVLDTLRESGPLRPAELAAAAGSDSGSIYRPLRQLTAEGLVIKAPGGVYSAVAEPEPEPEPESERPPVPA